MWSLLRRADHSPRGVLRICRVNGCDREDSTMWRPRPLKRLSRHENKIIDIGVCAFLKWKERDKAVQQNE